MKKIIFMLFRLLPIILIPGLVFAEDVTSKVPEENVRLLPNGKNVIGTVKQGARLRKVSEKDGWTQVVLQGWVYSPSLKPMPPDPNRKIPEGTEAFDVLHWNWKQLGKMIRIQGVAQNHSDQYFNSVKLIVTISDDKGNEVGSNYTYLQSENIKPGEVNGFKIYMRDIQAPQEGPNVKFRFEFE